MANVWAGPLKTPGSILVRPWAKTFLASSCSETHKFYSENTNNEQLTWFKFMCHLTAWLTHSWANKTTKNNITFNAALFEMRRKLSRLAEVRLYYCTLTMNLPLHIWHALYSSWQMEGEGWNKMSAQCHFVTMYYLPSFDSCSVGVLINIVFQY